MPDREKVITHLDDMRLFADTRVHQIVSPENWEVYSDLCDFIDLIKKEILDLLKEQEPQLVLNIGEQISCKSGSCPKCGKMLNTTCNKRYCGDCGHEVKWE